MDDDAETPKVVPGLSEEEKAVFEIGGDTDEDASTEEAKLLSRNLNIPDLEREAKRREHERGEHFRDHFESLAILAMWILFGTMLLLGVVWLLHMILPESCDRYYVCRWLSPEQVTIIQDIITGGLIAGLLADHYKRRMGNGR